MNINDKNYGNFTNHFNRPISKDFFSIILRFFPLLRNSLLTLLFNRQDHSIQSCPVYLVHNSGISLVLVTSITVV